MQSKATIYISKDLYEAIKKRLESSKELFKSVDEYVEFILKEIVKDEGSEEVYSPAEEEQVKRKLKSLGYF